MLTLLLVLFAQKGEVSESLPFIKADKINSEKVLYTKSCLQNIVRTFDERPVYLVQFNQKGEETNIIRVGAATCCYLNDKEWIEARVELSKPLPKDHVLRAHIRPARSKTLPDGTYVVDELEVVKFYLKPKDKAVKYD